MYTPIARLTLDSVEGVTKLDVRVLGQEFTLEGVCWCFSRTQAFLFDSMLFMQLPSVGTSELLRVLSPYIQDDFINERFAHLPNRFAIPDVRMLNDFRRSLAAGGFRQITK